MQKYLGVDVGLVPPDLCCVGSSGYGFGMFIGDQFRKIDYIWVDHENLILLLLWLTMIRFWALRVVVLSMVVCPMQQKFAITLQELV